MYFNDSVVKKRYIWTGRLVLALVAVPLFAGLTEGVLAWAGFSCFPREKVAYKPWVAVQSGTEIVQFKTDFDPPGYVWKIPEKVVYGDDPYMKQFRMPVVKKEGVSRIAFLGGSTTQPNGMLSYPERTIALLNTVSESDRFEAVNFGLSSYTTHQSLIVLKRYVLPLEPDCVVIYHGWNDFHPSDCGYGDAEMDSLFKMNRPEMELSAKRDWLMRLKIAQLVGKGLDALDQSWPRPRVNVKQFEKNLSAMIELCTEHNISVVLVRRPVHRSGRRRPYEGIQARYFIREYGLDTQDIYFGVHRDCVRVQDRLAERYAAVSLADMCAALDHAQEEVMEYGRQGVTIFSGDDLHVSALGNQYGAVSVAEAVAPELRRQIRSYVSSPGYWLKSAEQFQQMDAPFQCSYALWKVGDSEEVKEQVAELSDWAVSQYEFFEIFNQCYWENGLDVPLHQRLAGLARCFEMRPDDYGVALQVVSVCLYLDGLPLMYRYLEPYQPATKKELYDKLSWQLDSACVAYDFVAVEKICRMLLRLDPGNVNARQILEMSRQAMSGDIWERKN